MVLFADKAIIEHEGALGIDTGTMPKKAKTKKPVECFNDLFKSFNHFFSLFTQEHALDPKLVAQIFRQIMYYLSMFSVNFLMQSQKHCSMPTGIQIK